MLYFASLVLIYLIPGSLCLLTAFIQLPLPPTSASGNHKSDLFFFSFFFKIIIYLFIYLFLAVLGLCCCARAFSSCSEQGLRFVAVRGLLIAVASLVAEHGLQ